MDKYDENFNISESDLNRSITSTTREWITTANKIKTEQNSLDIETLITKFSQNLYDGVSEGVDFNALSQIERKPDWLDLEKIKIGQEFAQDFYSSIAVSELICLIFALSNDKVLRKLISTNKSSEPYTAFKRYLSTGERVKTWLFSDLFDETSEANKNIKVVNAMHQRFYKKIEKMDKNELYKMTELSNCPFLNIKGKINADGYNSDNALENDENLETNKSTYIKTNFNKSALFLPKISPKEDESSKINPELVILNRGLEMNEKANINTNDNQSDFLFPPKLNPKDESSKINPHLDVLRKICNESSKCLEPNINSFECNSNLEFNNLNKSYLSSKEVESTIYLSNLQTESLKNASKFSLNKSLLQDKPSVTSKIPSNKLLSEMEKSQNLYQILNEDLMEFKPIIDPEVFLMYTVPMTQAEMCGTQFSFVSLLILYPEHFGVDSKKYKFELECFCHLWRYLGYRLGTKDKYNLCTGTFHEIRTKSQFFLDVIIKPALQKADHKWEHMTRSIVHGLHYSTEGASFEAHLIYGLDLINISHPKLDENSSLKIKFEVNLMKFIFKYLMSVGWIRNLLNRVLFRKINKVKENMPSREQFYYKTRNFNK